MKNNNKNSIRTRVKLSFLRKGLLGGLLIGERLPKAILFLTMVFMARTASFSQNLSVMTYNIRLDVASDGENAWEHRKEFLTDQIKFYSPDVVGTQEGRPNQIAYMKNTLTDYKMIGHGRDGGDNGEYSAIFYNTNTVKVEQDSTFWLSKTPEKRSKGRDAAYERICTYGLFTDLKSLEKVWIINTHLDHVGQKARLNGMQLIQERIKIVNTKNYPVIIMGDFNAEPDNELITNLKRNFIDTKEISELKFGPSGTFNGFKFNEPVIRRIDYVFVSKKSNIKVNKYAVLSDSKDLKYPSDHLPVLVRLELE